MMHKQEMHHYNAQCPHCRRVNRLSQDELLHAAPDWTPSDEQPEQEDVSAD
jgi:phage FluMu protein Com